MYNCVNKNGINFLFFFSDSRFVVMAKGKHAPAPGAVRKNKVVHPNSRQASRMLSKQQKASKNQSKVKAGGARLQALGEKLCWLRDGLEICLDEEAVATPSTVAALAEAYLTRFQEELEQIKLKGSIGGGKNRKNQHASRQDLLESTARAEREEFEGCGLEMPDLLDKKNLDYFRSWQGELRYVQNIKLRRFSKKWLEEQCDNKDEENEAEMMDT